MNLKPLAALLCITSLSFSAFSASDSTAQLVNKAKSENRTQASHNVVREADFKKTEQEIKANHVQLKVNMTLGNSETIKQAVMADLGISVVSRHSVTLELATGVLKELDIAGFPLQKSWSLVHHETKHLSPIAKAFVEFVLSPEENVPALCNRFLAHHFVKKA